MHRSFTACWMTMAVAGASGLCVARQQEAAAPPPTPEPVAAPSRASVVVPADRDQRESAGWRFEIGAGFAHAFEADIDAAGSVGVSRAGLEFSFDAPLSDRARIAFEVNSEASFYDFDGATTLLPGTADPWDDLYSVSLGPVVRVGVDENWSWFVGADVRFSGESETDVGEAVTFGGLAGARYAFSKTFALTFGAFGTSRLEDDPLVLPLIGVEWQITDKVRLATRGTGLSITATLTESLEFSILGAWNSRDYRLEDGRLINSEGVVRDTRVPVGVELAWTPDPAVRIALEAGVVAWQEFETFDRNGNDIADDNTDPTAYVGVAAVFRF